MNITTAIDGDTAKITVEGKLSVTTSPELESAIMGLPESVVHFDFDLAGLDYISSAGHAARRQHDSAPPRERCLRCL